jgi:IS605 OrfB family transposase
MIKAKNIFTYQGRLKDLDAGQSEALDAYATHYNYVEHKLYADMRKSGASAAFFKNNYLVEYGLTARQFNAIGRNLEGKISSVKELLPLRRGDLAAKIERLSKTLPKIKDVGKLHQKKRRLAILEGRLAAIDAQIASGDPQICFGSKKLFQAQYNLELNGFVTHEEWRAAWQSKRNSQFFVIGSGDEAMGCQGCVISANMDDSFNLKLRLLGKEASYASIENLCIPYGGEVVRSAIEQHQMIQANYALEQKKARAKTAPDVPVQQLKKSLGPSISYRFLKDAKGWRVFISTEFPKVELVSVKEAGAVGIDINADCIALAETDRFGNLVGTQVFPLVTYGKSSDQAEAIIGDVVKEIVAKAVESGKPIILEKLDFSKKKAVLNGEDPKYARMLSSLTYNGIKSGIKARAFKHGI